MVVFFSFPSDDLSIPGVMISDMAHVKGRAQKGHKVYLVVVHRYQS